MENIDLLETGGARDITWRECLDPKKWVTEDFKLDPQAVERYHYLSSGAFIVEFVGGVGLGVSLAHIHDDRGWQPIIGSVITVLFPAAHFAVNTAYWPNRAIKHLHEKAIKEMQDSESPKEEAMEALVFNGTNSLLEFRKQLQGIALLVKKVNQAVLNKLNNRGASLLEVVMKSRNDEICEKFTKTLLKEGADPFINNGAAFVAAIEKRHRSSAEALLKNKAELSEELKKKIASYCDSTGMYKLMKENINVSLELLRDVEKEIAVKVASSRGEEKISLLRKQVKLNEIIQLQIKEEENVN